MKLFVTATGTDCGKTVVSAILCQALNADYWKPVQTGAPPSDSSTVKNLVSFPIQIFPETHLFSEPVSPHYASEIEGKKIKLSDFLLPETNNNLIVEGAGGLLVPLNEHGDCVIDLIHQFELEVVLVIRLYLGCINHALLSINELKRNNIAIKGLIFNGTDQFGAISIIEKLSNVPTLLHLANHAHIDSKVVSDCAKELKL